MHDAAWPRGEEVSFATARGHASRMLVVGFDCFELLGSSIWDRLDPGTCMEDRESRDRPFRSWVWQMPTDNALHKAAHTGDLETLMSLLMVSSPSLEPAVDTVVVAEEDAALDVNAPGAGDRRPIHRAAGSNHADVIKFLIERGAVVDQVTINYEPESHGTELIQFHFKVR